MVLKTGDWWHCTNAACGCSIIVATSREADGKSRLCACGGAMKKQYAPPVFRYLDFLGFPAPVARLHKSPED